MSQDKYNHWLGRALAVFNGCDHYAITLGQTTYYSAPEWYVNERPQWRAHEDIHKEQWRTEGKWKFACKYIWFNLTRGYRHNPYELKAGKLN